MNACVAVKYKKGFLINPERGLNQESVKLFICRLKVLMGENKNLVLGQQSLGNYES